MGIQDEIDQVVMAKKPGEDEGRLYLALRVRLPEGARREDRREIVEEGARCLSRYFDRKYQPRGNAPIDPDLERFLEATEPSLDAERDRDEAQHAANVLYGHVLAFAATAGVPAEGQETETLTGAAMRRIAAQNRRAQVAAFMSAFGHPIAKVPTIGIDDDAARLRARLVAEEFFELMRAMFNPTRGGSEEARLKEAHALVASVIEDGDVLIDIVEMTDACADLDYVVEGLRLTFGIDGAPIAMLVHESNMAKVVGGTRRADGKIQKPANWQAPNIIMELRRQGLEQGGSALAEETDGEL